MKEAFGRLEFGLTEMCSPLISRAWNARETDFSL